MTQTKKPGSRLEQNAESTYALCDLLRLICSEPQQYADNAPLNAALNSQGKTAKLEFEFTDKEGRHRTIQKMSKNTLEKYANDLLDRGYKGLEDLRMGALRSIQIHKERSKGANKRTKIGLQKKVEELENELLMHKKTNLILLQGLSVALRGMQSIKQESNMAVRDKGIDENMEKLRAIISLNSPPFDQLGGPGNIIEMEMFRNGKD
ncbi:hypothetical protein [Vreelandella profundi]|uniref:hypothetical protein n=1 Tax=Vreelandella profundi TaxID=2852117 RepID=UPI001F2C7275|nr:hypothetical protein [Halomonas profundi]